MPPKKKIIKKWQEKGEKIMKLTEKSQSVFDYIKANGGKVSIDELATALDRTSRSVGANVTDLSKKGLVVREKVAGEGEDAKEITYAVLTEDGKNFVPTEDAE
jgi:DNA-binding MarR family transcriptional regulator